MTAVISNSVLTDMRPVFSTPLMTDTEQVADHSGTSLFLFIRFA